MASPSCCDRNHTLARTLVTALSCCASPVNLKTQCNNLINWLAITQARATHIPAQAEAERGWRALSRGVLVFCFYRCEQTGNASNPLRNLLEVGPAHLSHWINAVGRATAEQWPLQCAHCICLHSHATECDGDSCVKVHVQPSAIRCCQNLQVKKTQEDTQRCTCEHPILSLGQPVGSPHPLTYAHRPAHDMESLTTRRLSYSQHTSSATPHHGI